jgi:hypothetical protein
MSEEPITVKVIEQPITGEIWWIAAVVKHTVLNLPDRAWYRESAGIWEAGELPDFKQDPTPWDESQYRPNLWSIAVLGDSTTTMIRVTTPADKEQVWIERLQQIDWLAEIARDLQRLARKMTAEGVIERYYYIKRSGRKATIKQLSQEYGFNENYLYQVKAAYDKSGKEFENPRQAYKVSEKP